MRHKNQKNQIIANTVKSIKKLNEIEKSTKI